MRIDLFNGGRRPWYMRLGLNMLNLYVGTYPGPTLTITYRPDLFHKDLVGYLLRATHGSGGWDKGHAEMFSAFVSKLNSCHF